MKTRGIGCYTLVILCFLLMACGKNNDTKPDFSSYTRYGFQEIPGEGIISFTAKENGELLFSTLDGKLATYGIDGAPIEEKDLGKAYWKLCYDGGCLYGYDYSQSAIVELEEDGTARVVENTLPLGTIRNIIALDGKLYVLAIPATGEGNGQYFNFGNPEFEDNGGVIYCVDADSGEYHEIDLEHIMAEYRSENGELYFYGWQEDKYYLYTYDTKKGKVAGKQHQDSMGNLLSIVAEGGYLFGVSQNGLVSIDLDSGEKRMIGERLSALFGNDLQFSMGNLFLCNENSAILHTAFIEQDGSLSVLEIAEADEGITVGAEGEAANQEGQAEKRKGTVALSMNGLNLVLDDLMIKQISGMKTKVVEMPLELEARLTELMAGNENVDIYFFRTGYSLSPTFKELGLYVPLNGSEKIMQYLDSCFDYVKEAATSKNGDIWMFPLYGDAYTTWYVPENMEKFGLGEENLDTMEHYWDTLAQLQGQLGDYRYYNRAMDFIGYCIAQYDYLFNDYDNNKVDYRTDTFRNLMKPLWDGWEIWSAPVAEPPLFYDPSNDMDGDEIKFVVAGEDPDYDASRVVFKTNFVTDGLYWDYQYTRGGKEKVQRGSLEGWRVMEAPKIRDISDVQGVDLQYAMVNPYSKQKDAAIAYLEAIASNPNETIMMPNFLRKDIEAYSGWYDITEPAFLDLYEIYKNIGVISRCSPDEDIYRHIRDYQQGKISFEQTVDKYQRGAEMGLYE